MDWFPIGVSWLLDCPPPRRLPINSCSAHSPQVAGREPRAPHTRPEQSHPLEPPGDQRPPPMEHRGARATPEPRHPQPVGAVQGWGVHTTLRPRLCAGRNPGFRALDPTPQRSTSWCRENAVNVHQTVTMLVCPAAVGRSGLPVPRARFTMTLSTTDPGDVRQCPRPCRVTQGHSRSHSTPCQRQIQPGPA